MVDMDASQSALDSLRTVEFRETLKGYHRDDVDEYLEKAAVEAEGLQEQLRQNGERLRQAAERISQLEAELERKPEPERVEPAAPDDTLQRTLLLAQKFVDETKADSEAQAARVIAEADAKARLLTDEAQAQASKIATESEERLRGEIERLEGARSNLSHEVESMSRHLESERQRLRNALGDILKWVDDNVHPLPTQSDSRADGEGGGDADPGPSSGTGPASSPSEGNRPVAGHPQDSQAPRTTGTGPSGDVDQMRPTGGATRPAATNSPLPL
jgi:DivIVA domain-containing protein